MVQKLQRNCFALLYGGLSVEAAEPPEEVCPDSMPAAHTWRTASCLFPCMLFHFIVFLFIFCLLD